MILHGYVKQCKYITMLKNVNLITRGGEISYVFEDKPAKWPIAKKKKNHQNIHPQLLHMTL